MADLRTVDQARDELRAQAKDGGADCPCCGQLAKVYRRTIHASMARALVFFYNRAGLDPAHKPTILRAADTARDEAILRYWGLFAECPPSEWAPAIGHAGWWRVTPAGADWIHGRITVPRYALVYDSRCLGLEGEPTTIVDALGDRFDLAELMG